MTKEQIIKGLTCHSKLSLESEESCFSCDDCPYNDLKHCSLYLTTDALSLLASQPILPNFIKVKNYILDANDIKILEHNYLHNEIRITFKSELPILVIDIPNYKDCDNVFRYILEQLVKGVTPNEE